MKVTYSWIIYSCIIYGTGIQCDRKLEKRHTGTTCLGDTEDHFKCSNGQYIEWPVVCDGHKHCSDGSDETNELCAIYEFGTNMTMDCGRVNQNIISKNLSFALAPWSVKVQESNEKSEIKYICMGTIIAPNIVISDGSMFWNRVIKSNRLMLTNGVRFRISKYSDNSNTNLIDVSAVYLPIGFNHTRAINADLKIVNIIVFVLANKFSFDNGFIPICIDWFGKYDLRKKAQMTFIVANEELYPSAIQGSFPYTDNSLCTLLQKNLTNTGVIIDKICIKLENVTDLRIIEGLPGSGLGILHSASNFLNGILISLVRSDKLINYMVFTDVQYYVPWFRGIFNKHVTVNSCILPTVEGVIYSYEGSDEVLPHGTLIDRHLNVIENCDVGYHKAYPISFRVCMGKGKWYSSSYKLCYKMCPPLISDSLDFKCSHNCKYANCSDLSIPDTIATPSCKQSYYAPYGQEDTLLELVCQSNGIWNNRLYRCIPYCGKINNNINNGMISDGETASEWNGTMERWSLSI
ncbi:uncharacterized protein LOC100573239 [Acyrthosiphon pisum]|uniref:Sushi domain-containing protein n=1 Tax=Acyrthosiphon pisum TaxID=7029 RepID=A0A8R2JTT2_ACYPI|nr:uncharacterized protein LOC100573239 [Acyrthosiphon pisum]XP_029346353.1 uncharacterized protein LOC100573239 [Acyrthosiphon pisum]XP_029346354.1 uncharacterized protein LOC100573239 [Acyrthosiphon pisum]